MSESSKRPSPLRSPPSLVPSLVLSLVLSLELSLAEGSNWGGGNEAHTGCCKSHADA